MILNTFHRYKKEGKGKFVYCLKQSKNYPSDICLFYFNYYYYLFFFAQTQDALGPLYCDA